MAIISLVNKKEITYGECVQNYLDSLTEEERNSLVDSAIVFGVGEQGGFYSVIKEADILVFLGLLEQLKHFLILESLGDDDEES